MHNGRLNVASYNVAQQIRNASRDITSSVQLTLNKEELRGGIQDLLNHLCVDRDRNLMYGILCMTNLPFTIFDGTSVLPSPPNEGRRLQILCVGLGFSRQLRRQWLSVDSPIGSVLVNVTPPISMVLPALNDFTYPTLINNEKTCHLCFFS